jgi:molybdopterin-guanine dinucleotide biosynthesis protein
MRPVIIGIGGSGSGSGKTTLAVLLLKRLPGWGAIKFTKTTLFSSITDDEKVISQEGKDTKKMLDSGAGKVLWVSSPSSGLAETASMAVEMLAQFKGIVVEGNSIIEVLKPDIVIFVKGSAKELKKGAERVLSMADVFIGEKEDLEDVPEKAKIFHTCDMKDCIDFIIGLVRKTSAPT